MDKLLQRGIRLFNDGEFFQCHEVLEEAWTAERAPRRLFLQALIHLAVSLYHCQRGNPVGASRQLHKGLKKLAKYLPACEGIDTSRLYQESLAALEQIEAGVPLSKYPQINLVRFRLRPGIPGRRGLSHIDTAIINGRFVWPRKRSSFLRHIRT